MGLASRAMTLLPRWASFNKISHFSKTVIYQAIAVETALNLKSKSSGALSKCISASGDGALGSAFWRNLNGISLPVGRYPVIVGIINCGDLTNVARQDI